MKKIIIDVEIELVEPMLGTVPKDPAVYATFIETKKPNEIEENESLTVEQIEQKGWTGFHKDEKGYFIYDYMIRGFLKNAGNILKESLKIKALASKIDKFVFVFPRRIYLPIKELTDVLERPLRAMTMQGPRVTLARSDTVPAGTCLQFTIQLLPCEIDMETLESLFEYGELCGLGQFRNGSYGRFIVTKFQVK